VSRTSPFQFQQIDLSSLHVRFPLLSHRNHRSTASQFGNNVPHGVYAPLTTFFTSSKEQDLDLETYKRHVKFVASAGVGIVCLGSMGEAVQLTHSERNEVVEAARQALDSDDKLAKIPLIVGTGASSTKETIQLTKEAAERGADFAMVITPGYFAGALNKEALKSFFVDVAEASPIPVRPSLVSTTS
jgi:L-threo-3-deoxy-hexylosonate aldolase